MMDKATQFLDGGIGRASDDGWFVSKNQARKILSGKQQVVRCDCKDCNGRGENETVVRNNDGSIQIGCTLIGKAEIAEIKKWCEVENEEENKESATDSNRSR